MSRVVMSSILSQSGQAKISRMVVLVVLFGALLGLVQPGVADAETLTAGPTTAITATSTKNQTSQYVLMSRITVSSTGAGDGLVTLASLTITNQGPATIAAGRVYISSNGTATTMPSDALQIGRTSGLWSGNTTTGIVFTGGTTTQRSITTGTPKYLYIAFDLSSAVTGTTRASVTTINVGSGDTPATGLTSLSNTITVSATGAWAAVTACTDCHGTTLLDAPTRSAATGSFQGSHNKHVDSKAIPCAGCHVYPASTSSTDHRDNYISMAPTFSFQASAGNVYSKTVGTTLYRFAQTSTPTPFGTCSTLYCHSNGAGSTSVATWGGTMPADCTGCHGNNNASAVVMGTEHPNHLNSTLTGRNFVCADCHNATITSTTDRTIATQANHVSGKVNIKFNPAGVNLDTDGPTYGGLSTSVVNGATVTGGIYYTCNNVYCHSTGNLSSTTLLVPVPGLSTFKTPTWQTTAVGCAGCHGDGSVSYPNYATGSAGSGTANSHAKHVADSGLGCAYCHNLTMGSNTSTAPSSLPSGTAHLNRAENVVMMLNKGLTGTYNLPGKTCSVTYCHGTGASPAWGGATNCASCHDSSSALSTGATNSNRHSMHYETTNVATTIDVVNGPTLTQYQFGCGNCHNRTQISHATGTNDVRFNIVLNGLTPTTGTYAAGGSILTDTKGYPYSQNGQCNNIYCHSNGAPINVAASYKTVTWNQAVGTGVNQCSVCHGGTANSTTPIASNKHTFHITQTTYNFSCAECHGVTTTTGTTIADKRAHVDGTKDVNWRTGGMNSDGSPYASPSCNNIYCHSNGQSSASPYVLSGTSVTWNVTQTLSCAGCHNYVAPSTTISSGAHLAHLNTSIPAGAITCNMCHNATTNDNANITTFANHVNKNVTVQFISGSSGTVGSTYAGSAAQNPSVASKAVGQPVGACNTTLCHGGNSQTWSYTNPGVSTCVKCHGVAGSLTASVNADPLRVAPGYVTAGSPTGVNTSGTFTLTDAKVGAHDAHLRATNGYKPGGIGCDDCHAVSSLTSAGHMNGSTTFVWSNTARNLGTTYNTTYSVPIVTPTYGTAGPGSCATNYCHGGAFIGTSGLVGTDPTPTWNDIGYLSQPASAMDQANCNRCHLSPPTNTVNQKYDHSTVTFGPGACNACHNHDGNSSEHINGILYGSGKCDSCHSYDVDTNGDWGFSPKAVEGWGAHATHIRHLKLVNGVTLTNTNTFGGPEYAQVCGVCHTLTDNAILHSKGNVTNQRSIVFGDTLSYQFSTLSGSPTYNGVTGTSSQFAAKTCSNVSCHYQATPVWQGY